MISTITTITARVAVTGFLSVSCFKRAVVDNTVQVLSKAEKASAGLAVYSVCMSTITLVLAADKAAQRFLSNEAKHMPAAPKDDDADCNSPSANNATTSATPQPVALFPLRPYLSPSLSRLIESTESPSANDNTTSAAPKPVEPSYLHPSPPPSPLRLIESTEIISATISTCMPCINFTSPNFYCKRLSIDSDPTTLVPLDDDSITDVFSDDTSDTDDRESFSDGSTVHEDDRSEPQPRKERALERTALDNLIARTNALILDDPPRPPKLRPLILVTNRHRTSTIPYPLLPKPAYPMDALTRSMQALSLSDSLSTDTGASPPEPGCPIDALTRSLETLSLGDRPSPTSKLKPLLLVTKRDTRHFKLPPPATTLLRQPKSKTITRSQTYWPFSLNPTIWAHPQPN
ncbi:hypothetical protein EDB19DRAFT_740167 [Suillus lakei]|nr:hypothetical protein EDB19DRAFT_740167 [Suillus lakei]